MIPPLLQSGIDLTTPDQTTGMLYVAVAVIGFLAVGVLAIRYRARYLGLSERQREEKQHRTRSKYVQTPDAARFKPDVDFEAKRPELRRLVDPDVDVDRDVATLRGAAAEVAGEAAMLLGARFENVPQFSRRLLGMALYVLVTGALAVSTGALVQALQQDTPRLTPATWPAKALTETTALLGLIDQSLAAVPGGDFLFTFGILVWTLLYEHWFVTAGLLALAAGTAWYLDDQLVAEYRVAVPIPTPRSVVAYVAAVTAGYWALALGIVGIGRIVDAVQTARVVAVVVSTVLAVNLLCLLIWRAREEFRDLGTWRGRSREPLDAELWTRFEDSIDAPAPEAADAQALAARLDEVAPGWDATLETRVAKAYLAVRLLGIGIALVVAPLLPVYTVVALTRVPELAAGVAAAPQTIQVFVLVAALLALAAVAYALRGSWGTVRDALVDLGGRVSIRALMLRRGVPFIAAVVAYLLAWAFTNNVLISAAVAVVGVVIGYIIYQFLERVIYRVTFWERTDEEPFAITIQSYALTDADGTVRPYVEVNGKYQLARDDVDDLLDAVVETCETVAKGKRPEPSLAQWYGQDLLELGLADEAESLGSASLLEALESDRFAGVGAVDGGRAWEHGRKRILDAYRPVGSYTTTEDLEAAQAAVPTPIWDGWQTRLRRQGLVRGRDEVFRLERDPWAELTEGT